MLNNWKHLFFLFSYSFISYFPDNTVVFVYTKIIFVLFIARVLIPGILSHT